MGYENVYTTECLFFTKSRDGNVITFQVIILMQHVSTRVYKKFFLTYENKINKNIKKIY